MRFTIGMLVALVLAVAAPAQDFTEALSAAERSAAGLNKLSAEELAALKAIVDRYKAGELAAAREKVAAAEAKAREAEARTPPPRKGPSWVQALITMNQVEKSPDTVEELRTRLDGAIETFTGKRTFRLENGQVWQMVENGSYAGPRYVNPEVSIRPGMLGVFWLRIPEAALRVKVKPIKLE